MNTRGHDGGRVVSLRVGTRRISSFHSLPQGCLEGRLICLVFRANPSIYGRHKCSGVRDSIVRSRCKLTTGV